MSGRASSAVVSPALPSQHWPNTGPLMMATHTQSYTLFRFDLTTTTTTSFSRYRVVTCSSKPVSFTGAAELAALKICAWAKTIPNNTTGKMKKTRGTER